MRSPSGWRSRCCSCSSLSSIIYPDRDGYRDVNEDGLTLLDCFYYAVVSLSTTGYGDITPATPDARLVNILMITPARVLFLIILVGTTLEVLTDQYRNSLRVSRWRRKLKDHVIICGYGTKGRAAVGALLETGYDKSRIVVVESRDDGAAAGRRRRPGGDRGQRDPLGRAQRGRRQELQGPSSSPPTATRRRC